MFILRKTKIGSKNQKQPNANIRTIDKYIVFYSYIEIILSNKKKKELLIHPSTHINFKNIGLGERSRTQKKVHFTCFCFYAVCVCVLSHVRLFVSPWTVSCQVPQDFPGKNTEAGCHFLLQGIFPIQGLNPHHLHLLHWQVDSLSLVLPGKPMKFNNSKINLWGWKSEKWFPGEQQGGR